MGVFRILSIDGGQGAYLATLMLEQINARVPGFLQKADLFAGTSSGSTSSLTLATADNPADKLPALHELWSVGLNELLKSSPVETIRGITGCGPLTNNKNLIKTLCEEQYLGQRTFADLKHHVVVPTFSLQAVAEAEDCTKEWSPMVFQTLNNPEQFANVPLYHAAVCSSSAPVQLPPFEGCVDGGTVANNPVLIAVGEKIREYLTYRDAPNLSNPSLPILKGRTDFTNLKIFSLGTGRTRENINVGNPENWGYIRWALDPSNPLLIINAFMQGSSMGVDLVGNMMFGENYFRLNPFFGKSKTPFFLEEVGVQERAASSASTQQMVDDAVRWIEESGWLDEGEPETEQEPVRAPAKARNIRTVPKRRKSSRNKHAWSS